MVIGRFSRRRFAPSKDGVAGGSLAAADEGSGAAVLDAEALRRLGELDPTGANRLLVRVFEAFGASVVRLLPQLHAAHKAADHAGVRHVAHTLKSSSASIGAIKLSQLCAEIEGMIRVENLEGLAARIDRMDHETAVVLQALKQLPGVAS